LLQDDSAAETLIAEIGIVDTGLIVGDYLARGAEHIRQTLRNDRIIIRASAEGRGRQTKCSDQEYAEYELTKGIGPPVPTIHVRPPPERQPII